MYGTGNRASYNEIHGGPHLAIQYAGNNQIMEYNEVYDVCTETDDMSAFYALGFIILYLVALLLFIFKAGKKKGTK